MSYFLHPTNLTGEKEENGGWHLSGTTTVKDDAKPGKGSVLFECAPGDVGVAEFTILPAEAEPYAAIGIQDRKISGEFTILGADPAQANPATPQAPAKPQVPVNRRERPRPAPSRSRPTPASC